MTDVAGNPVAGPLTVNEAETALLALVSAPAEETDATETHQTETEVETPADEAVDESSEEAESTDEDDQQSDDEAESNDDDEQEEEEAPQARKVRVKIDGKDEWVTEDELKLGYSRTKDYTQKTQKLAQERKEFEDTLKPQLTAVQAERQKYATDLGQIEKILTDVHGAEPDWAALQKGELAVFAAEHAAWTIKQNDLAQVRALKADAEAKVARDRVEAHNKAVAVEAAKLPELIPSWKDPKVAQKEMTDIVEHARSMGYTDADINGLADARVFVMLRNSMLLTKAKSPAVKDKIKDKVRTATPGSPTASVPKAKKAVSAAVARVAKTGSMEDGTDAILKLLGQG